MACERVVVSAATDFVRRGRQVVLCNAHARTHTHTQRDTDTLTHTHTHAHTHTHTQVLRGTQLGQRVDQFSFGGCWPCRARVCKPGFRGKWLDDSCRSARTGLAARLERTPRGHAWRTQRLGFGFFVLLACPLFTHTAVRGTLYAHHIQLCVAHCMHTHSW